VNVKVMNYYFRLCVCFPKHFVGHFDTKLVTLCPVVSVGEHEERGRQHDHAAFPGSGAGG
jgi:hypothetical protein